MYALVRTAAAADKCRVSTYLHRACAFLCRIHLFEQAVPFGRASVRAHVMSWLNDKLAQGRPADPARTWTRSAEAGLPDGDTTPACVQAQGCPQPGALDQLPSCSTAVQPDIAPCWDLHIMSCQISNQSHLTPSHL